MEAPKRRKKLIEVVLSLAAINIESAREKFIRHGQSIRITFVVGQEAVGCLQSCFV